MQTITKKEWLKLGKSLYGDDMLKWRFVCPSCGHIQCAEDFRPYKEQGIEPDIVRFNCIGRYNGHIDTPIGTRPGPCNYTSGGLLNLCPVKVVDGDKEYSSFAFANLHII